MSSKHGVLCQKIVTSAKIDLGNIDIPKLSEEVQRVVREAELKSLEGLLGPDPQIVTRQLVEKYWSTK